MTLSRDADVIQRRAKRENSIGVREFRPMVYLPRKVQMLWVQIDRRFQIQSFTDASRLKCAGVKQGELERQQPRVILGGMDRPNPDPPIYMEGLPPPVVGCKNVARGPL